MVKEFKERVYNIPLRKEFMKVPRWKRAKRSIIAVKKFVEKHTRIDNILIGNELNNTLWKSGSKNPPSKIKVFVQKTSEDTVFVNTFGSPKKIIKKKKEEKEKIEELEEMAEKAKKKSKPVKKKKTEKKKELHKMNARPLIKKIKKEDLSKKELDNLLEHEKKNKNRKTVVKAIKEAKK